MVKYGLRDQGKNIDEVMESFKKQTSDSDFLEKVVPLMIEKVNTQNEIQKLQALGIDLDDVNLSHITAVNKDIDLTFKINNIFIGKAKLNSEEEQIQKTIRANDRKLSDKNLTNEEINNIKEKTKDLKFELESKDYYKPVPKTYVEDEIFFPTMMRTGVSEKKDGGLATMEYMTRPLNAQR